MDFSMASSSSACRIVFLCLLSCTFNTFQLQCQAFRPWTLLQGGSLGVVHPAGIDDARPVPPEKQLPAEHARFGRVKETLPRNSEHRELQEWCNTGNPIDDCWRCDPNWEQNRQALADCAIGFGKNAAGGKKGQIYVVTDDSDDDAVNPRNGTLRWGVLQAEPLWIIFDRDMKIQLQQELIMMSYKTIDGRGYNVHIAGGAGITIQYIQNVIVHSVHIYDCVATGPAMVRSSPDHFGKRGQSDGSAFNIFNSSEIWLDHLYLANCAHLLIGAIEASTYITISNNYFTQHDMVILLGAHPEDTFDVVMQVTIAYNHFASGLIQRMPRCRFGYFHIVNNDYTEWQMYAIGGSESPTILSEGNRFKASNDNATKEVTKRIDDGGDDFGDWENWNWRSSGDMFENGAFFTDSGTDDIDSSLYAKATSFSAKPSSFVASLTAYAGVLQCGPGGYGSVCGIDDVDLGPPMSMSGAQIRHSPCHPVYFFSLALCCLILCALRDDMHIMLI
jgi:pectate lyase